jgi:hypothetical protein
MRIPLPKTYNSWIIVSLVLLFALPAVGQGSGPKGSYEGQSREGQSRAELEAEQRVSLSADKIIEILRNEPGLMLQVKKMLVRKAFEQGRIVDPSELTDDALYRLVRDDENIRIIATREIEDRSYIRAKPTKEELARQDARGLPGGIPRTMDSSMGASSSRGNGMSQEEAYWGAQQRDLQQYQRMVPGAAPPSAPGTIL